MKSSGFTLLETIIYCALFSVLMTSALVTVYALLASTSSTKHSTNITTETLFLQQKLGWVFSGATDVSVIDAETIAVTRPDLGADSPLVLHVTNDTLYLTRGAGAPLPLTGQPVKVTAVQIILLLPVVHIDYQVDGDSLRFEALMQ